MEKKGTSILLKLKLVQRKAAAHLHSVRYFVIYVIAAIIFVVISCHKKISILFSSAAD